MSEKEGKCQYESWGDRICYGDALPESEDHYCICHEQSNDKDIEAFNREIEKIMQDKKAEFYDFRGFYFPKKFNSNILFKYLEDRTFRKYVDFEKATIQGGDFITIIFQEGVNFSGAMLQNVNFEGAMFQEGALFFDATLQDINFEGTTFLAYIERGLPLGAEFEGATIINVKFETAIINWASFEDATFIGEANFVYVKFQKETGFTNATFQEANFEDAIFQEGEINFNNVKFKKANFKNTVFEKRVHFIECEIKEKIDFQHAHFYDELLLTNIKNKPIFDFRNTVFSDKTWGGAEINLKKAFFNFSRSELVDFTGAEFPEKLYEEQLLEKKELNDEEKKYCPESWEEVSSIYRKLKQAHQKHGQYDIAGEFYYREMECKKKALKEKKFSLNWFKSFGYSFLKWSCGYGEKPLRVMRNSLISVLGFAFAYFFTNSINLSGNSVLRNILQSIYFSTITFTTLGYGDIHPINDVGRVLAMSEAVLGAIFIALFIFVFGRKMMR